MPSTPQQQQVQNLRSDNDIKEQAINQAKQDMIIENERNDLYKNKLPNKNANIFNSNMI